MDWKVIILTAMLLVGCATKKKSVESRKSEVEDVSTTFDSSQVSSETEASGITSFDFSRFLSNWSIDYDGDVSDGFRFYMNKTEHGWEAGAEGKGKVKASEEVVQEHEQFEFEYQSKFDSLWTAYSNLEKRLKSFEKSKDVEKESTGLQVGGYITIAFVILFVILFVLLAWRFGMFRRRVKL